MARQFTPKIVTANDLFSGDVIYLTPDSDWSAWHGEAELLTDQASADRQLRHAESQQNRIVGPYLADARSGSDGRPEPVHFREIFRSRGPSNYFYGKQAELGKDV